jgi:hypothetical protein
MLCSHFSTSDGSRKKTSSGETPDSTALRTGAANAADEVIRVQNEKKKEVIGSMLKLMWSKIMMGDVCCSEDTGQWTLRGALTQSRNSDFRFR